MISEMHCGYLKSLIFQVLTVHFAFFKNLLVRDMI